MTFVITDHTDYTNHYQVMPCLDWNVKKKSKREENPQISSDQDQNQMIHEVFLKRSSFNLHDSFLGLPSKGFSANVFFPISSLKDLLASSSSFPSDAWFVCVFFCQRLKARNIDGRIFESFVFVFKPVVKVVSWRSCVVQVPSRMVLSSTVLS